MPLPKVWQDNNPHYFQVSVQIDTQDLYACNNTKKNLGKIKVLCSTGTSKMWQMKAGLDGLNSREKKTFIHFKMSREEVSSHAWKGATLYGPWHTQVPGWGILKRLAEGGSQLTHIQQWRLESGRAPGGKQMAQAEPLPPHSTFPMMT